MDFAKSKFDTAANPPKSEEKSVQLAEVHLYRSYFLQNPYFRTNYSKHYEIYFLPAEYYVNK